MNSLADKLLPEFIGESILPIYRDFAENMPVGLYILQRGRFCHLNGLACQMLGYESAAGLLGKRLWAMVHPEDRKRVKLFADPKERGGMRPAPFRVFKSDGSPLWISMQGVATSLDGKPAHIGYIIDMTSLRYLSRALKKYRARINQVEDAILEIDLAGNIVSYTQAACKVWRIFKDEFVGRYYRDLLHPDTADKARLAYRKVCETGLPNNSVTIEMISKKGHRRIVEDSVSLIRDRDGRPLGFRTVSRDITRQKETEQKSLEQQARLEAIFRSVKDAIVTVDPELRIISANAAAKSICGLDVEAAAGQHWPDALAQCCAACAGVLRQTLETRKPIQDYRVECRHEKCRRQIVDVSSAPLTDPENHFMGAVLVIRDRTHLLDLERELQPRRNYKEIIGQSRPMQDIYLLLEDLADLQTTVLVTGESGTGKSLIAKALHQSGHNAAGPFVTVCCSALAENLLESELFGHARGAFTGAVQDKIGRFEAADGGAILIDEVGDASPLIQLKLLRVLQEKTFERVGESVSRTVNVRVIACTNQDLKQKVAHGEFREDLYYRLNVVEVQVPPLRERMEDVPLLIEHFCQRFNQQFAKQIEGLADDVLARLMDYHWPGNVRELEHAIEHAFVYCDGPCIRMAHLPPEIRKFRAARKSMSDCGIPGLEDAPQKIITALDKTFWNKGQAAQMLGISRQTLYRKMQKYRILNKEL